MASRHGAHTKIERCCSVSAQERRSEASLSNEGDVEVEVGSRSGPRSRLLFEMERGVEEIECRCVRKEAKSDGKVQEY